MKKWNRSLGTSKREQGVITPVAPHNRGRAKKVVEIVLPWYIRLWRKLTRR